MINVAENIKKVLPHGSGIDYDWDVEIRDNGDIVCRNAFHRMDENGCYDGIFPFTATFKRKGENTIHFNGLSSWGHRVARNDMLKDYLENVLFDYYVIDAVRREGMVQK